MTLLDEVIAKLGAMPPAEKAKARESYIKATGHMKWVPNPGPQTAAYLSKADVLLYGGQAGGGKSQLILGLAQEHQKSIIYRRESSQTDGLEADGKQIYSTDGFNGVDLEWNWKDGRSLKLAGMKQVDDWIKHAGRERDLICVSAGTEVLMGDGTYRVIERLKVGDSVATLEGPRKVERCHPIQARQSVKMVVRDNGGKVITSQIQSINHPVLTTAGWISAGDLTASHQSTPIHASGSISQWFSRTYEVLVMPAERFLCGLLRMAGSSQVWRRFQRGSVVLEGVAVSGGGNAGAMCCETFQARRPLALLFSLGGQIVRRCLTAVPSWHHRELWRALSSGRASSKPSGLTWHCLFGTHQYDERLRQCPNQKTAKAVVPQCLLLSTDAVQPTPTHLQDDGLGQTRTHTHLRDKYAHPYTKEIRQVAEGSSVRSAAFEFSPVGVHEVYDLQIEEVRHYITRGGIVNQNCYDEAGEFVKKQIASLMGWNRGPEGQRCRIVLASNPPRTAEGLWMMQWFAPWLDRKFPNPAAPGELRWAVFIDGDPMWVDGNGPVEIDGELFQPLSLTFIPAALSDNPYRDTPEYRAKLNSLPEPLRSQLLYGDFTIGMKDAANQLIPTAWVMAAIERWRRGKPEDVPMCSMGVDASGGGDDPMIIARRWDGWYDTLIEVPGRDLPMDRLGAFAAGVVVSHREDKALVVIDLGGGYGGSMFEHLKENEVEIRGFKGAESSTRRSRDGSLKFTNKRTAAYWLFREALDPGQPGGSPICLPDDPGLIADLTVLTFEVTAQGIKAEPKDKVMDKLGRSPDRGDAVVMAWHEGPKQATAALEWADLRLHKGRPQVINSGRTPLTAKRQMSALN